MSQTKKITKLLPCQLTTTELATKRDELASVVTEYDRVEADKKAETKVFSDQMKALRQRSSELSDQIRSRTEKRAIECAVHFDDVELRVDVIRSDTGELLESRPMTPEERQQTLDLPIGMTVTGKLAKTEA